MGNKITDKQLEFLKTLKCERLCKNKENMKLLQEFENEKGNQLVRYLKEQAWSEDDEGTTAYYLVKLPNDSVVMFFSLK